MNYELIPSGRLLAIVVHLLAGRGIQRVHVNGNKCTVIDLHTGIVTIVLQYFINTLNLSIKPTKLTVMNPELKVIVLTEEQIKKLVYETMESILEKRIPEIMRRANRKEIMTTKEVAELTGMSSRIQQYHRENKNIPYFGQFGSTKRMDNSYIINDRLPCQDTELLGAG